MTIPVWLVPALALQLVLVFFAPPIPIGDHRVFVSDLWYFLWLIPAVFSMLREGSRQIRRGLAVSAILMGAIYAHGACRTQILTSSDWHSFFYLTNHADDLFKPGRELIIGLRFLSWIYAGAATFFWFSRATQKNGRSALNQLYQALALCIGASGLLMTLEALSPSFQKSLGGVFLFDPAFPYWAGRAYGPFGSPVEAAAVLVLGIALLIAARGWKSRRLALVSVICALIGFLCSKTLTPVLSFVIGVLGLMGLHFRRKLSTKKGLLAAALGGAALCCVFLQKKDFLQGKLIDLVTRFGPWGFFLKHMASRPDSLGLGLGLIPLHTDNSYLFILTRGGIAALACVGYCFWRLVCEKWRLLSWKEQGWIAYLLITGMMFDLFIYRHVVAVLIVIGIPSLALARRTSEQSRAS